MLVPFGIYSQTVFEVRANLIVWMPYSKSGKTRNPLNQDGLQQAANEVLVNMSLHEAARLQNITKSTLRTHGPLEQLALGS
ncbi:hypothetical protein HHI36_007942 [Cryptolaemus montrouzieri]|uniref:HTH psq-type domain-containing protein n=1 Tax=Cryptolaemus montrouzieri TaxID=559131 RepID=A0ABD2MRA2_9CUCU